MSPKRLGLIGNGAIGRMIINRLRLEGRLSELVAILVRSRPVPEDPSLPYCYTLEEFMEKRPEVAVEAAGHEAVIAFGPTLVAAGMDLAISSVGALADERCIAALREATLTGGRVMLTSGAIAGLDGLAAAQLAGLDRVTYTSRKPPHAWVGTPAETTINLDHQEDEIVFFEGSARHAASDFPKNANVSAAVALAGIGFERTNVKLVSSRLIDHPEGIIEASGDFGRFRFEILANAFPENPKSSMLTAFALLQTARHGIGIPLTA